MYKKGTGNDKQGKDAGNRTLCPYTNFGQAIKERKVRAAEDHANKCRSKLATPFRGIDDYVKDGGPEEV